MAIWKTCKVCTETLRDTLSSGINVPSMSAMVTDLQTHETPEGLLTHPVFLLFFNLEMSTAVEQVVACALVTQRTRVRSPVGTSFLGEVFSGFFLTCKTNVRKL